jgi:hypothetical protein
VKGRKIVFAGLARNVAPFLAGVTANIVNFASHFDAWAVLVAENDSQDGTKPWLKAWMEKARTMGAVRADLIELDGLAAASPIRTDRIAIARNRILAEIERDPELRRFDYLAVLDMDFPNSCPLPVEQFAGAIAMLERNPGTAGVFANSLPLYYDIWALRQDDWCPRDCWEEVAEAEKALGHDAAWDKFVFCRQHFVDPAGKPIAVDSAFGGMAVYRLKSVAGKRYAGLKADGGAICEHVPFHASIRADGGEFFILPEFLNLTSLEHTGLQHSHGMMAVGPEPIFLMVPRRLAAERALYPRRGEKFAQLAALHAGNAILDLAPQGGLHLAQARLNGCKSGFVCVEGSELEYAVFSANALMHARLFGDCRLIRSHDRLRLMEPGYDLVRLATGKDAALLSAMESGPRTGALWACMESPDEAPEWRAALSRDVFEQVMVFNALGAMIACGPLSELREKLAMLFAKLPRSGGGLDLAFFSAGMRGLFEQFRAGI